MNETCLAEITSNSGNSSTNLNISRQARSVSFSATSNDNECVAKQDQTFNWLYLTADITNYLTTYIFGVVYDVYGSRAMRL